VEGKMVITAISNWVKYPPTIIVFLFLRLILWDVFIYITFNLSIRYIPEEFWSEAPNVKIVLQKINFLLQEQWLTIFVLCILLVLFYVDSFKRTRIELTSLAKVSRETVIGIRKWRFYSNDVLELHLDCEQGIEHMNNLKTESEKMAYFLDSFLDSLEALKYQLSMGEGPFEHVKMVKGLSYKIKYQVFKSVGIKTVRSNNMLFKWLLAFVIIRLQERNWWTAIKKARRLARKPLCSFMITKEEVMKFNIHKMRLDINDLYNRFRFNPDS
jgi:hypothetical protein